MGSIIGVGNRFRKADWPDSYRLCSGPQAKMGAPTDTYMESPQRSSWTLLALTLLGTAACVLLLLGGLAPGHKYKAGTAVRAAARPDASWTDRSWTDTYGDGTPDFMRLTDPADQAAFRRWFTAIAEFEAVRPRAEVPAEIVDCASLVRYAYREALKRHNEAWFATTGVEVAALPGEIRAWHYPETPLGAGLFRVRPGSFARADAGDQAFAQFADAKNLVERNAYRVGRDVREAQAGDLLFYRQFGQSSPWHSMIVTRTGSSAGVVYDTGTDHGRAGQLRRVAMAELLTHPEAQWRPVAANPNFLGVYRWNILR
jgi:uncharacterized protein YfaT (DUF1175 family)